MRYDKTLFKTTTPEATKDANGNWTPGGDPDEVELCECYLEQSKAQDVTTLDGRTIVSTAVIYTRALDLSIEPGQALTVKDDAGAVILTKAAINWEKSKYTTRIWV